MSHPDRPDPPDELPAAELAMLSAYRSERAMPRSAKARMIERLEAEPAIATTVSPSIGPRVIAAGVAVAAALVLVWGVTNLRSSAVDRDDPSTTSPQAAMQPGHDDAGATARNREPETPPRKSSHPALAPAPLEANPEVEPPALPDALDGEPSEIDVEPSTQTETDSPRPRRRVPRSPAPEPEPPAPEPASQLQQERALLAKAWTALADGHPGQALGHTRDHADRFSSPILGIERKAIATIAGCQTKRPGWPERAESFLSAHGKTPLAPRVREACHSAEKKTDGP